MNSARPANVDDDVLAIADRLTTAAADYRRLEARSWKWSVLATVALVVCGTVEAIPTWTMIVSSMVTGHFLGRAVTARRRRRAAIAQSGRLRALVRTTSVVAAREISGAGMIDPRITVITSRSRQGDPQ